jgi:hypothetical protein
MGSVDRYKWRLAVMIVTICHPLRICCDGFCPKAHQANHPRRPPHCPTDSQKMSPYYKIGKVLASTNSDNPGPTKKNKKKTQGVYVRPSGAIERGSGFFVPGLEGPRVRLVFGTALVILTGVNHVLMSSDAVGNFSFQETLAIAYSALILFQSAIEYVKEQRSFAVESNADATAGNANSSNRGGGGGPVLIQEWASTTTNTNNKENEPFFRSKVQWAAVAYTSMTPTQEIMLLSNEEDDAKILYRLGPDHPARSVAAAPDTIISRGVQAALEELGKSKSGRISLPLMHPAVQALVTTNLGNNEPSDTARTVILQRITDRTCWMIVSKELLASYTSGDLKWLGQMAANIAQDVA